MAATCAEPVDVVLDKYDTNYFYVNASLANTAQQNTLFGPIYAFANDYNFFYKAADKFRYAYTITFNATRIASVTSLSFHQSKASVIQVAWASVDNVGDVSYSTTVWDFVLLFLACLEPT